MKVTTPLTKHTVRVWWYFFVVREGVHAQQTGRKSRQHACRRRSIYSPLRLCRRRTHGSHNYRHLAPYHFLLSLVGWVRLEHTQSFTQSSTSLSPFPAANDTDKTPRMAHARGFTRPATQPRSSSLLRWSRSRLAIEDRVVVDAGHQDVALFGVCSVVWRGVMDRGDKHDGQ